MSSQEQKEESTQGQTSLSAAKSATLSSPTTTPGPWAYDKVKTSCGHCFRIGAPSQLAKERDIRTLPAYACLYVDYGNAGLEAEANARLIAAAPCLLEALEISLGEMEAARENITPSVIVQVRRVIARAKDGVA